MSVLIKGMEMPTSCDDCPLAGDFKCNLMPSIPALCKEYDMAVQNGKRLNNCPLIEIPPHGRLIDADAAVVAIQNSIEVVHDGMQKILLDYAQKMFNATPTIIPAEEGET